MKRGTRLFYSFIILMTFLFFIGCSLSNFDSSEQSQAVTRTISTAKSDSLTSFNSGMWEKADWNNGSPFGCAWNPNNISFSGSGMTITLNNTAYNGRAYSGGEYRTRDTFDYGTFSVSMSTFTQSGTVQSFLLYTGSPWDEIDVEKIGTKGWQYNYFKNGQGGHEFIGNGSSTIVWASNYITYGGRTVNGSSSSLPSHPMQVMMNVWNHDGSTNDWLGSWNYSGSRSTTYRNFNYTPLSGGGGSTTTTSSHGGGSTTTTSSSGGGGGSNINYRLRARSTDGQGKVNLRIDSNTIATFTLGSSMGDYTASSYSQGSINVEFFNDATDRDVQVDYLSVNGDYRQAENQGYNTAAYQNGSCGGGDGYTEWMHCNGVLGFGDTPGGGGGGGGSSSSTTTSSWGGGGWWWW
jgi:hypothetical protein